MWFWNWTTLISSQSTTTKTSSITLLPRGGGGGGGGEGTERGDKEGEEGREVVTMVTANGHTPRKVCPQSSTVVYYTAGAFYGGLIQKLIFVVD